MLSCGCSDQYCFSADCYEQRGTDWLQCFWLACLAPNSGCSIWTQGQELVLYLLDFDFCPCACHRDEDKQMQYRSNRRVTGTQSDSTRQAVSFKTKCMTQLC